MKNNNKQRKEDLFDLLDWLICYEKDAGVRFNEKGYPIFEGWMFYRGEVIKMLPYRHRNDTDNKQETFVCFFEPDLALYPKLNIKKLQDIARELQNFAGFVGFDLSIFKDFLYPMQELYILANLVIDVFLIMEGNLMIPNLRADQTGGESYFGLFEKASIVCCGTLGCAKRKITREVNKKLISEYSINHPDQLLIQYGPNLVKAENTSWIKSYGRKVKENG